MLLDNRRQPVGSLVVRLQEADLASRGVAEPGTSARVGEQILPAQHPFSESHRPPVQSPEQDVGLDIVELLDQVVGQIRIMTDGADETTKVRIAPSPRRTPDFTLTSCCSSVPTQTLHGKS